MDVVDHDYSLSAGQITGQGISRLTTNTKMSDSDYFLLK